MEAVEYARLGADAAARLVKFTGSDQKGNWSQWWINLSLVVAARLSEETVRGHLGHGVTTKVLTLFLPASTPLGEALVVRAYDDEAVAVGRALDAAMTMKTPPVNRNWDGG